MSVLTFDWIGEGRTGGGDTIEGEVLRTRVARVRTSVGTDGEAVVLAACDSHGGAIGAAHPDGSGAFLQRRSADNMGATKVYWVVTCHYSNKLIDNPLDDPAEIDSTTEKGSKVFVKDRNGVWVTNSAGLLYNPPAEIDDSRVNFRVKKNVATRPSWYPAGYKDRINSDAFTIDGLSVVIGHAKMQSLALGKVQTRNGVDYRELSLEICVSSELWDHVLLDSGFEEIDPNNANKRRKIVDDSGKEPSEPWPLNGLGRKLANPTAANLTWRTHHGYLTAVFGNLPLT